MVLTLGRRLTAILYVGLFWMLGKSTLKCPGRQSAILYAKNTHTPEALYPLQDLVPGTRTLMFPQPEWTTNQALENFFPQTQGPQTPFPQYTAHWDQMPALRGPRQEDGHEFDSTLDYMVSLRPTWAQEWNPVSNSNNVYMCVFMCMRAYVCGCILPVIEELEESLLHLSIPSGRQGIPKSLKPQNSKLTFMFHGKVQCCAQEGVHLHFIWQFFSLLIFPSFRYVYLHLHIHSGFG